MASGDYEERKSNCRLKNPCVLIRNLVEMMEHPISEQATGRHLQILNEFLNASHYAFWLQDIPYIIRLYESIVKRLDDIPEFKRPLECLLYFSAIPPMLTKASDQTEYARDFQEYFSVLGCLILCLHEDDLKKLVLDAIHNLLIPRPPIGYCCVPPDYCKEVIEKSRLPEILAQLLQAVGNDIYPYLLDVTFLVCQISQITCEKMLQEEPIEYLIQRFEPTWRERDAKTKPRNPSPSDTIPVFEDTCCILWKLLKVVDKGKGNVKNPSLLALWSLQYAFRWSCICPGKRVNRNNLMAIILKLVLTFPGTQFCETELTDDIPLLAAASAGCKCSHSLYSQFSDDEIDFQFKKMIYACLFCYEVFNESELGRESDMIRTFMKNLFQDTPTDKLHMEQYCELAKIILKLIPKFVTCASCDVCLFLRLNGPIRIINMIDSYLLKTYNIDLLEAYMFCLSEIIMFGNEDITRMLANNESDGIIIPICNKVLETEILSRPYQNVLARGLCILQKLCESGSLNNCEVVNMCLRYLNRVIHPPEDDPLIDVRVTICAVHLLWDCIVTARHFHGQFLKQGGIYVMLDITQISTFPVKSLSLGVLADVSKKPSCVPHFITWRKCGRKLLPMLMEIFRDAAKQECGKGKNIELNKEETNMWLSLCKGQRITFYTSCIPKTELLQNCRSKIHAILYALQVKHKKVVEIANEHYKLFNDKLNTDDELTMVFAENFLSLKMCESWMNVAKEFKKGGITPVDADNMIVNEKIQSIRQWRSYLRHNISDIIYRETQNDRNCEVRTYKTLKEARLSDALDALKELRYISNCTERLFRMRQKLLVQREADTVRVQNSNFHRTICELPLTNIYNQTINIQSNIIYEKKEEQCPITPVSSDDEVSLESSKAEHELMEHQPSC